MYDPQDNLIPLSEAASYAGCTPEHLNLLARQGKIRAQKVGRNWVTCKKWIDEYFHGKPAGSDDIALEMRRIDKDEKIELEKIKAQIELRRIEKEEKVELAQIGQPVIASPPEADEAIPWQEAIAKPTMTPSPPPPHEGEIKEGVSELIEKTLQEQISKITSEAQSKINSLQSDLSAEAERAKAEKEELASFFARQLEEIKQQLESQKQIASPPKADRNDVLDEVIARSEATRQSLEKQLESLKSSFAKSLEQARKQVPVSPVTPISPIQPITPFKPLAPFKFSLPKFKLPKFSIPKLQPRYITIGVSALAIVLLIGFASANAHKWADYTLEKANKLANYKCQTCSELIYQLKGQARIVQNNMERIGQIPGSVIASVSEAIPEFNFQFSSLNFQSIPNVSIPKQFDNWKLVIENLSLPRFSPDPLTAKLTEFRISNTESSLNSRFSTLYSPRVAGAFTDSTKSIFHSLKLTLVKAGAELSSALSEVEGFLVSSFDKAKDRLIAFVSPPREERDLPFDSPPHEEGLGEVIVDKGEEGTKIVERIVLRDIQAPPQSPGAGQVIAIPGPQGPRGETGEKGEPGQPGQASADRPTAVSPAPAAPVVYVVAPQAQAKDGAGTVGSFKYLGSEETTSKNLTITNNLTQTGGTVSLANVTVTGTITASGTQGKTHFSASSTDYILGITQNGEGSALRFLTSPSASSTVALLQLADNPLISGNPSGTYIGVNPQSFSGDFLRFQVAGQNRFVLDYSGSVSMLGSLTVSTTTASSSIAHSLVVDTTSLVVNASENRVGVGTASPLAPLHVAGQCVTGDTRLRRRRRRRKSEARNPKSETNPKSPNSNDSNSLEFRNSDFDDDYIYDEVRIDQVEPGDEILSLNEATGRFEYQKVKALMDMGVKQTYQLLTEDGRSIRTTGNHPYLVMDIGDRAAKHSSMIEGAGWLKVSDIRVGDYIAVAKPRVGVFIDNSNVFYAQKQAGFKVDFAKIKKALSDVADLRVFNYYAAIPDRSDPAYLATMSFLDRIGKFATLKTKPLKYIEIAKGKYEKKGDMDVDLSLDIMAAAKDLDAIMVVSGDSDLVALRDRVLSETGKKFMFLGFKRGTAWEIKQGKYLEFNKIRGMVELGKKTTPELSLGRTLLSILYPQRFDLSRDEFAWVKMMSIQTMAEEQVWDIEVEGTHNFVGNDIVAHNTFLATSSGNVGIGNTNPGSKLEVTGGASFASATTTDSLYVGGLTQLTGATASSTGLVIGNDLTLFRSAANTLRIQGTSILIPNALTLDSNGTLSINTTNNQAITTGTGLLTAGGSIDITGNLDVLTTSATSTLAHSLVVDTSTLVVNANENRVGIGTAVPSSTLSVLGSTILNGTLRVGGGSTLDGNLIAGTDNTYDIGADGASRFRDIFLSRNITIGNAATTTDTLTVGANSLGQLSITQGAASRTGLGIRAAASPTANLFALQNSSGTFLSGFTGAGGYLSNIASSTAFTIQNGSGTGVFTVNTATGDNPTTTIASYLNVDSGTLYVDALGNNVGIGTTGPNSKLVVDVNSNSTTQGTAPSSLVAANSSNTTNNYSILGFDIGSAGTANNINRFGVQWIDRSGSEDGDFFWGTIQAGAYGEKMRLTSTGNLGIATSTPDATLSIENTGTGKTVYITDSALDTTPFVIDAAGNVGIGTTNTTNNKVSIVGANQLINVTSQTLTIKSDDAFAIDKGGTLGLGGVFDAGGSSEAFAAIAGRKENSTDGNASGYLQFITRDGPVALAERMRITSLGNVGIGTTSPTRSLHLVASTTAPILGVTASTTDTHVVWKLNGAGPLFNITENTDTSRFYINNAGNVGIGTTGPTGMLQVEQANTGTTLGSALNLWTSGGAAINQLAQIGLGYKGSASGVPPAVIAWKANTNNAYEGDLVFAIANRGDYTTAPTAAMTIQDTGNVGIGTTAPGGQFQVSTSTLVTSASGAEQWVSIGTTVNNVFDQISGPRPLLVQKSDAVTTLGSSLASFTIANGNTTTSNTAQINFAAITGASTAQYSSAIISTIFGARTNAQYPTGQLVFLTSTALNSAPTEKMRITNDGNVGIGTTGPGAQLSIAHATGGGQLQLYVNVSGHAFVANSQTGKDLNIQTTGTGDMYFQVGGSERVIILDNGNVGIGTTGPRQILELASTAGEFLLNETDAAANSGLWGMNFSGGLLNFRLLNDAYSASTDWMVVERSGTTVTDVSFPNGNVGIGTTSPTRSLHLVASTTAPILGVTASTTDTHVVWKLNGAGPLFNITENTDTSRFYINNAGNIGIGTTGPGRRLEVESTVSGEYPVRIDGVQPIIELQASGVTAGYIGTGASFFNTGGIANGLIIRSENIGIQFAPGGSGTTVATTMLPNGNVGIGTTNPLSKLDVVGAITTSKSGGGEVRYSGSNGYYSFMESTMIRGANQFTISRLGIDGNAADDTVSADLVTVDYTGNVGIGTTSPGYLLDVNKGQTGGTILQVRNTTLGSGNYGQIQVLSNDATGIIRMTDSTWTATNQYAVQSLTIDSNGSGGLGLSASGATAGIKLYTGTASATPKVTILSDGNVGIGTTGPSTKLHLLDATPPIISLGTATDVGVNNAYGVVRFGYGGVTGMDRYAAIKGYQSLASAKVGLQFDVWRDDTDQALTAVTITNTGNVGIGTTGPQAKLQVENGQIRLNGTANELDWYLTSGAADQKRWRIEAETPNVLAFRSVNDAASDSRVMMQFNRTDWVTGLNVSFLPTGGNVGIATTTPAQTFVVVGSACFDDTAGAACASRSIASGAVEADGPITGNAFDLAETYASDGDLEASEVVRLSDLSTPSSSPPSQGGESEGGQEGNIPKVEKALGEELPLGIVSSNPAFIMGWNKSDTDVRVALVGRVPVKISEENGAILPGDFLTVSATKPGYAMKMTKSGQSIGMALEPSGSGEKILIFVNLGYQKLTADTDLEGLITVISDSNDTNYHSNVSNRLKFNATAIFTAKLIAENGQWELNEQGYLKIKELEVERIKIAGNRTVGHATIAQGEIGVDINTTEIKNTSKVFVTFRGDLAGRTWYLANINPGTSFTIKLSGNLPYAIGFDWWIIDSDDIFELEEPVIEATGINGSNGDNGITETTGEMGLTGGTSTSTATTTASTQ